MLRIGSREDFEQLFEIFMSESNNRFLNFEIMDIVQFSHLLQEFMQSGQLYIEEEKGRVVAACFILHQKRRCDHVATVSTLAVHPEYQNKGVGKRFLKGLIQILKNQGKKRVDLMVEADNPKAMAFYEKLGFQREGILKKYFQRQDSGKNTYVDEYLYAIILE